MTRLALWCVGCTRFMPLSWVRALGTALGWLLFNLVRSRRHVVLTNLRLCFPQRTPVEREALARQVFRRFAQAWLDRGWLWHAPESVLRERLRLTGEVDELTGNAPTVIFAPHFVGLDAGWTAITQQLPRTCVTIYSAQANAVADAWILKGRQRFGAPTLVARLEGIKPVVSALRQGQPLYLLPDMNFDPTESLFVPFFGVSAATVPSLSRFARLGRAKVVMLLPRMTKEGYAVEILPAWEHFPSDDLDADTRRMNRELERYIAGMPDQYYWVHKRFKDRPPGETSVY